MPIYPFVYNLGGAPALVEDVLANRPNPEFAGRVFIATDAPYGIFRDTGIAWVTIATVATSPAPLQTAYIANGTEGKSVSIPSLAGKNVFLIFRAGSYMEMVAGAPTGGQVNYAAGTQTLLFQDNLIAGEIISVITI